MDSRMHNSADEHLWRRFRAAADATPGPQGPCLDELTLASYLDGQIGAGEIEAVELHLAHCASCRAAVAELRGLLEAPATVMPPADFAARAAHIVARTQGRPGLWRRAARWSAVAAAVLIVAWGGYTAGRKTHESRQAAAVAVARRATFDLDLNGEQIAASVDAFDEMLLAGGDEQ